MVEKYTHPEVLIDMDWVASHLNDPMVRVIEADEDVLLYEQNHIPSAVKLDWQVDVQNPVERDFVNRAGFERLVSTWGIANDTTVVFYGDRNNWYACYSFWLFTYYGHADARIMNGGRQKWIDEHRPLTREVPQFSPTPYQAKEPDPKLRAFRDDVMALLDEQTTGLKPGTALVDVRSPGEYSGEILHMIGYPREGAQRGGHIPGARSIPWGTAANPDGTFKSPEELREIYASRGVTPDRDVVVYCRIGERSSHTWFVLTYLLGFPRVRNYDGSWTEWGNLVRAPIEKDV
ncbi:MAG: sulfurtransferase [Chloroflexi bacterium]|nr:sulfurtransferase [Chloroflexota bacterium]